jgi:hypothetical protein
MYTDTFSEVIAGFEGQSGVSAPVANGLAEAGAGNCILRI